MRDPRDHLANARVPPHSDDAEQSVLGALLLDSRAWDQVADVLSAEHFYHPDHRAIFTTIGKLVASTKPVDVIAVCEHGGHDLAYVNELSASVISANRARSHAEIVLQRWREREAIRIGTSLADDAQRGFIDTDQMTARFDAAVTALLQLSQGSDKREPQQVAQLAVAFSAHLEAVYEGKEVTIRTGLTDLDRLTAEGIREGELWVIGARPSMGKTALTNTLARNMAQNSKDPAKGRRGCLFLSQEDSYMALMARHVAALGRVNLADLRNPAKAPESMWSGMTTGVHMLTDLDLWIDDQAALTMADVRRKVQQVKRRTDLGVVMIDYLQLMTGEGDNRNIELGKIANGLKKAAKDLGVGVILLSQLNREVDKRIGPPVMSDLRDSGDIEGAADLIALLHREHKRNPTEENKHHAELHVVKHKNGATGTVDLHFDGAFQRFGDWEGPPPRRGIKRAMSTDGGLN